MTKIESKIQEECNHSFPPGSNICRKCGYELQHACPLHPGHDRLGCKACEALLKQEPLLELEDEVEKKSMAYIKIETNVVGLEEFLYPIMIGLAGLFESNVSLKPNEKRSMSYYFKDKENG